MSTILSQFGSGIHCARDLTRGGMATALVEIAQTRGLGIRFQETQVPTRHETPMACDMLGVDPYHLANEGCAAIFVGADIADEVLAFLREARYGANASIIGEVVERSDAGVVEVRRDGSLRAIKSLEGRVLPRLC
ncbi:AIR synthase-related protein [Luteibacter sp. E-22]|uniref:AIR synthase-related protein n=1 Tax=Luteibacter sp. E-22 TaxID=3404050 RepID=UPI003CF390EC